MKKGLFLDPAGIGTTGGCLVNLDTNEVIKFYECDNRESKDWLEQLSELVAFCKQEKPSVVVYETTTYISPTNRGHYMTSLFKLFGGIESLRYIIDSVESIETLGVRSVKNFKDRVLNRAMKIEGLEYQIGRGLGWIYKGQKISLHQLDAFTIYWWWSKSEDEKKRLRLEIERKDRIESYYRVKARKKSQENEQEQNSKKTFK